MVEAPKVAALEGVTMRELVEGGLRQVVDKAKGSGQFRLPRASFADNGLSHFPAGPTVTCPTSSKAPARGSLALSPSWPVASSLVMVMMNAKLSLRRRVLHT